MARPESIFEGAGWSLPQSGANLRSLSVPMGGDGKPLGALPTSATTPAVVEVRLAALRILS